MLVSSVIDRVCLQLAEDTSSPNYLSRAQILTLINNCTGDLAESLHCFTKKGFIRCKANKPKYTLASDLEQLIWVTYDGKTINPSSIRRWEEEDESWRDRRGDVIEYALDPEKNHVIWLRKCPDEDGDIFLFDSDSGVPYAIIDPYSVEFDAQTQDFTVGETATGGTSGATAEIIYVDQNGYSGTLYFESNPGTFTDDESLTDSGGGSATVNGTTTTSGGDTWLFTRSYGLVTEITGDSSFWDLVDDDGEEATDGIISEIWSPNGNLIYKYSYYPAALVETDHLPRPYREANGLYLSYVMYHALMVEAEGQDVLRALHYAQQFERSTGIKLTQPLAPQRQFVAQSYAAGSDKKATPTYPDNWPPVDRGY